MDGYSRCTAKTWRKALLEDRGRSFRRWATSLGVTATSEVLPLSALPFQCPHHIGHVRTMLLGWRRGGRARHVGYAEIAYTQGLRTRARRAAPGSALPSRPSLDWRRAAALVQR